MTTRSIFQTDHQEGHGMWVVAGIPLLLALLLLMLLPARAGAQLFDFDNAPIHTSLPIDLTAGGVTAHFSGTGAGFSIQPADVMGFTPAGFGGLCIYPNSVFAADLQIDFSVAVTDLSILYAPQELGCDDSAILRLTATADGVSRGTVTATAPQPGTWPTGTLVFGDPRGFNSVVIHYDRRPACGDWGPIFMADRLSVAGAVTAVPMAGNAIHPAAAPNPFAAATEVRFLVARSGPVTASIQDAAGRHVRTLIDGAHFTAGTASVAWDGCDEIGARLKSGVYFCRVRGVEGERVTRVVLLR